MSRVDNPLCVGLESVFDLDSREACSTGTLYGSTARGPSTSTEHNGLLVRIDEQTGAGTLIGDLRPDPDDETAADITFTPDGALFGWLEPFSDDLAAINKATGLASIVGNSGLSTEGTGLASDSAGTLFLATDVAPLWTINRATGAAAQVATLNPSGPTPALAFNSAGTLFGVRMDQTVPGRPTELVTINTASGAVSSLGPSVDRLDAIEFATLPSPPAAAPTGTCKGKPATIVGTEGNDVRTGTPGADVMLGLGGNDNFSGLAGNDLICGGAGKDNLKGGKGKDTLLGQKGNDKLNGGGGKDKLSGKKGKDKLTGGGGKDVLKGGGGKDTCIGGKANDSASKCEVEKSI
jgi:Ca2+-binding RTX toxin-like protein